MRETEELLQNAVARRVDTSGSYREIRKRANERVRRKSKKRYSKRRCKDFAHSKRENKWGALMNHSETLRSDVSTSEMGEQTITTDVCTRAKDSMERLLWICRLSMCTHQTFEVNV